MPPAEHFITWDLPVEILVTGPGIIKKTTRLPVISNLLIRAVNNSIGYFSPWSNIQSELIIASVVERCSQVGV